MISSRTSGAGQRNARVRAVAAPGSNVEWLRALPERTVVPGAVLLIGGSNVVDFRVRVAQSHLRFDLLPSFWSATGVLSSRDRVLTVPIDDRLTPSSVPSCNAIHEVPLTAYDDPIRYRNIGVVRFANNSEAIVDYVRRLRTQRSAIDLPNLLVSWLAFVGGAGATPNPLTQNVGIPSAALVETAFGISGIELTPGVASGASCPEAVWQSAIWWHEYYEKTSDVTVDGQRVSRAAADAGDAPLADVPTGAYVTRQPAAAVIEGRTSQPSPKKRGK